MTNHSDRDGRRRAERERRRAERKATRRALGVPDTLDVKTKRRPTDDAAALAEALANPTITVTPEQLRAEYGYVLADLRNMFVLAGALIVLLVVLAQFI